MPALSNSSGARSFTPASQNNGRVQHPAIYHLASRLHNNGRQGPLSFRTLDEDGPPVAESPVTPCVPGRIASGCKPLLKSPLLTLSPCSHHSQQSPFLNALHTFWDRLSDGLVHGSLAKRHSVLWAANLLALALSAADMMACLAIWPACLRLCTQQEASKYQQSIRHAIRSCSSIRAHGPIQQFPGQA